jgi:hypothetical protein
MWNLPTRGSTEPRPARVPRAGAVASETARGQQRRPRTRIWGRETPAPMQGCASRATIRCDPAERSPAVKGGPTGPSEAGREAAPLTARRSGATWASTTQSSPTIIHGEPDFAALGHRWPEIGRDDAGHKVHEARSVEHGGIGVGNDSAEVENNDTIRDTHD